MEYVRTVTEPIKQVSLIENMKGWYDDYSSISSEVGRPFLIWSGRQC